MTDPDWTPICELVRLPVDRGVTALVRGHAVAVFLTEAGHVYAIGNHDPFSKVTVLGRGIVGVRGEAPFVASTEGRQAFDLRTGVCLDDPSVSVPSYAVRVVDGMVQVGPRSQRALADTP
ncbi:MAG: nitrite reductase small subunit NirD [Nocardioidaceae bacterium]|nr:nitrite reductase small subunit NirD [Nocardioidaceae bacterium]NUS50284.1 nitrite reductase small subunit NirD [Nocardioidaceae bacterium]